MNIAGLSQAERWRAAAELLDIEVVAPFVLNIAGEEMSFAALLPEFGASKGMVIDPEWSVLEPVRTALLEGGYGFSCMSLDDVSDDASFRDMLDDWGRSGR